ncbi:MAG: hypothetical protein ABI573_12040 [Chloroflexota bacterium]
MAEVESTVDTAAMGTPTPSETSYAPSWANLLTARLERLPGPTWLTYLVGMVAGTIFSLLPVDLKLATPGDIGAVLYYGSLPFAIIGLIHGLDTLAGRALTALRPVLSLTDSEAARLRRELTVAPARPALVIAVFSPAVTALSYASDPVGSGIVGYTPLELAVRFGWESFITAVFLILIYHTLRQLRLTSQIHEQLGRVDLFDQAPLYAMSRLTSTTAIGLVLLSAPGLFLIPQDAGVSYLIISFAWFGGSGAIAAAAFVLPLRGTHDRIVAEKYRLQGEVGRRLTAVIDDIHAAVDAEDQPRIEARNRALTALVAERDLIAKVPTWPWSTGALTGFVSAILLPVALFLIQRVLSQYL